MYSKFFAWLNPTSFSATTPGVISELGELEARLGGVVQVKPRAAECLNGTRTNILSEIEGKLKLLQGQDNVAKTTESKNIILIRGAPGSGKSSISLTIKSQLHKQGRLLTYFRFDRNDTTVTTSSALWSRVAYDLADRYPSVLKHSLTYLQNNKVNLTSSMDLFTSLIEEPLSKSTEPPADHSLVIVIDALDECGGFDGRSSPDRRELLQTLERWPRLSKYFKLIVTSRDEGDILRVLSPISTSIEIPSGNTLIDNPHARASIDASEDIRVFLESRFRLIREPFSSLPPDWPGKDMITNMVFRAAGNFMWVTTATNFIDSGLEPQEKLKNIMGDSLGSMGMESLYSLYSTILETSFGTVAGDSLEGEVLRAVLGTIIFAQRPFHDFEFSRLPTAKPVSTTIIESIRDRLSSVLAPGALRFIHKSFDDFLLSKECPDKYAVRVDEIQCLLAELCLKTMTNELCFNICGLETSSLKNTNVPDIKIKIMNRIPALLSYSCCFFADHLSHTPFDNQLMGPVKVVMLDKLLYWLEVMSLLEEINRVSQSLLSVVKWSHSSPDDEFKEFVHDACRFIGSFIQPIAQSAPHIYISALPFAPEHSLVSRRFLPKFPWLLSLSTGKPTNWPPCKFTSEHHTSMVHAVVFSPDEKIFASGSSDRTIRICDSETGNPVSSPFKGRYQVERVFFDPRGRRVWANCISGQVVGWDVETRHKLLDFEAGHVIGCCQFNGDPKIVSIFMQQKTVTLWNADTGKRLRDLSIEEETYMVALSPNGCYIAAASTLFGGNVVVIWKLVDGKEIRLIRGARHQFKHEDIITALSFSPDSNFAVSGSMDGTILVWDVTTGEAIGPLLATGEDGVDAVAHSPTNGILVWASGSPGTITAWNTVTHERVLGPLSGHESKITEIALSRDGRWALTASRDGTVRKWDLTRKEVVPAVDTIHDHGGEVWSVTFSPCGRKLASNDRDREIKVWDTNTGKLLLRPIKNPSRYNKITFSPNGGQIIAYGSQSAGIRAWNTNTGELVYEQKRISPMYPTVQHIAFRSTDERLVTCSYTNRILIRWLQGGGMTDASNPQLVEVHDLDNVLALSPDGLTAIVCDDSGLNTRYYIWCTTKCQPLPVTLSSLDGEYISGSLIAYSPSGRFFVAAYPTYGGVSMLQVWNTQTRELVAGPITLDGKIECMAFSPNDRHIAFSYTFMSTPGGTGVWIWDTRTDSEPLGPWNGHADDIMALAFSLDGSKLVSGSRDGQMRIWSTADLLWNLQVSDGSIGAGTHMQDGWVADAKGNLLFWVPKDRRERLGSSETVVVIGGSGIQTLLDLKRFRYGENWAQISEAERQRVE